MTRYRYFALGWACGGLIITGVLLILIGLIDPSLDLKAKYFPPVFPIPKEINRNFATGVIDLTNIERQKVGLNPLRESSALSYAAYLRAKEILQFQDFSHEATSSGQDYLYVSKVVGYNFQVLGENLGIRHKDPNELIKAWLSSPGHKENLLKPDYDEIGVAVLNGEFYGENSNVIVQMFGKP